MMLNGAPPAPGPAVILTGIAFRYVSDAPCDFEPAPVPPVAVAVGAGGGPPTTAGSGPCELPGLQWKVRRRWHSLAVRLPAISTRVPSEARPLPTGLGAQWR